MQPLQFKTIVIRDHRRKYTKIISSSLQEASKTMEIYFFDVSSNALIPSQMRWLNGKKTKTGERTRIQDYLEKSKSKRHTNERKYCQWIFELTMKNEWTPDKTVEILYGAQEYAAELKVFLRREVCALCPTSIRVPLSIATFFSF